MQVPRSYALVGLILLLIVFNIWVYQNIFATHELRVAVLGADSTLVRSPTGKTLLIDFGADGSILRALGGALPFWQRTLDMAIKTSLSAKASGGLPDVVRRYKIKQFEVPAALRRGQRIELGGGVYADILWPDRDPSKMAAADGAVALTVHYGATSFLLAENLSPRVRNWLNQLDATDGELAGTEIATTTPAGVVYGSNGIVVETK